MTDANVWDQPIDVEPSEFITLPAGIYPFRVTNFERSFTGEKSKEPGTPMLTLTLDVYDNNLGTATVFHRIVWNAKSKWKQSEFFIGIGQRKHGETTFVPRWNEVIGATGFVKLKVERYNGSDKNEVDVIMDPEKVTAPAPAPAAPAQIPAAPVVAPSTATPAATYTPGKF